MLSSRYAPAVCVALLLALVPTIIHSYAGVVVDDGHRTGSIPSNIASYSSSPTKRPTEWGESHFDSHDWFEREYRSADDAVVLTVVRSYDLKALYHHPELAVSYHQAKFSQATLQTMPGRPDMPVHVLTNKDGVVGMYALLYDGRFVADPIRFQLRTAGELLLTGRKAMTLFFVRDDVTPDGVSPLQLPAARLLTEAVDHFVGSAAAGR